MSDFAYLHVHTHFSGGGGPASPAEWCRQAAALGYTALAIADRAPLAGLPAFLDAARREGLAPIIGVDLDVLLPLEGSRNAEPISTPAVLFAHNEEGLSNLSRLCALAFAKWPASQEVVTWEALCKYSQGLVLVLPGVDEAGTLAPAMGLAPRKLAEVGAAIKAHFGDVAFVGLPHSVSSPDGATMDQVASAAGHTGLPSLAFPTGRYLHPEGALAYAALKSARKQAGWSSIGKQTADTGKEMHLRAPAEAAALFGAWPEAVANVARVVEICSGVWNERKVANADTGRLRSVAERRLNALWGGEDVPADVQDRLDSELRCVARCGATQAWLALNSLVEAARAGRVPLGAPVGMADGALLAYALGVSSLNPMPYTLPAWLRETVGQNPVPLPGVEVPSSRRDMLISALARELGSGRVAHAACAVDVTPVVAAQAAGAILNGPADEARELMLGAMEKGWTAFSAEHPVCALAASLQGAPLYFKPDHETLLVASHHEDSSNGSLPPLLVADSPGKDAEGRWVPWTEQALCNLNYSALALPSSPALDVLDNAMQLASKSPAPGLVVSSLDPSIVPMPDDVASAFITGGAVAGLPYLTSKAAKGWSGSLNPGDMASLVAHSIATHKIQTLKSKIQNSEGPLLYRDQLDALLGVAGLPADDIERLRVLLAASEPAADHELWARFLDGCEKFGTSREDASALRDMLVSSARNLVSRFAAHEWARVALLSAMLKGAHPAALLAGALAVAWERGVRANVSTLVTEARKLGIAILSPDASRDAPLPSLERDGAGWAIRWGLALLPGWDVASAERFVAARTAHGPATISDLAAAAAEANLSQASLESLVHSGGCDRLGGQPRDRQKLLDALPQMLEWAQAQRTSQAQVDLFTSPAAQQPPVSDDATFAYGPPSPHERYICRRWEEANLGVGMTEAKEIEALQQALKDAGALQSRLLTTAQVSVEHIGKSVFMVGLLSSITLFAPSTERANNGNGPHGDMPLAMAQVEDLEGAIELVAFPPNYKRHKEVWTEHNMVIITARVCRHDDGALYLLCEHLAPFQSEVVEEELSLKVKVSRGGARQADPPPAPAKDPLAQTEIVAVPKAQPSPTPAPASTNGAHAQPTNGHSNGHSNGHAPQPRPVAAQVTGAPTYRLVITLPISDDDHTDIDTMISLNGILTQHPGSDAVTLRIPYSPEPGAVTLGHLPRGARYSSHLEAKLRDLLGPDALAVIKLVG